MRVWIHRPRLDTWPKSRVSGRLLAAEAKTGKNRVVNMRFGVVMSTKGGALAKLYPIFFLGGGGNVGSGRQYFSFISARDHARAIVHTLETPSLEGPVNFCAPEPCTNAEFTKALGSVMNRPTILPFPGFAVSLLFGEMGEEMLLGAFPTDPTGGTELILGDDEFAESSCGKASSRTTSSCNYFWNYVIYVGSNGYLTFYDGDTSYGENGLLEEHFWMPRISGFFTDLDRSEGGTISWKLIEDGVAVTFQNVPDVDQTGTVNFQIELFFDGAIRITWLDITVANGVARHLGRLGRRGLRAERPQRLRHLPVRRREHRDLRRRQPRTGHSRLDRKARG